MPASNCTCNWDVNNDGNVYSFPIILSGNKVSSSGNTLHVICYEPAALFLHTVPQFTIFLNVLVITYDNI